MDQECRLTSHCVEVHLVLAEACGVEWREPLVGEGVTKYTLHAQPPGLLLPRLTVVTLELFDPLQQTRHDMSAQAREEREETQECVATHRLVAANGADLRATHDRCENAEEERLEDEEDEEDGGGWRTERRARRCNKHESERSTVNTVMR